MSQFSMQPKHSSNLKKTLLEQEAFSGHKMLVMDSFTPTGKLLKSYIEEKNIGITFALSTSINEVKIISPTEGNVLDSLDKEQLKAFLQANCQSDIKNDKKLDEVLDQFFKPVMQKNNVLENVKNLKDHALNNNDYVSPNIKKLG